MTAWCAVFVSPPYSCGSAWLRVGCGLDFGFKYTSTQAGSGSYTLQRSPLDPRLDLLARVNSGTRLRIAGGPTFEIGVEPKSTGKNAPSTPSFHPDGGVPDGEDETDAERSAGGEITLDDGSSYHIPTQDECEKCHCGRTGAHPRFSMKCCLGLAGAKGITHKDLVDADLLSEAPASTALEICDDGSGIAPNVLGWFHANCGITCHKWRTSAPMRRRSMWP